MYTKDLGFRVGAWVVYFSKQTALAGLLNMKFEQRMGKVSYT